jgi:hypothetical protein
MRSKKSVQSLFSLLLLVALMLPALGPSVPPAQAQTTGRLTPESSALDTQPPTTGTLTPEVSGPDTPPKPEANGTLTLSVVSARTEPDHPGGPVNQGDPILTYNYLINVDNTGDPLQPRFPDCSPYYEDPNNPGQPDLNNPNLNYPNNCNWPSIRQVPGHAPIYTQGTQADFAGGAGLSLPPGKYIISVWNDTYKIGGENFVVPDGGPVAVTVQLQPHPLPPATMQIIVFEDISPTNGAYDPPVEDGLPGFKAWINDILGQVQSDVFGNPFCTVYDAQGNIVPAPQAYPADWCMISGPWDNPDNPNPDPDFDRELGIIKIPNLGPNRYDVEVRVPAGTDWIQTSTLEGSHSWDTWLQEGATGLDNEFVVAGEPFPWTWFSYVRPTDLLNHGGGAATGGVSGTILSASVYLPQTGGLPFYGGQWNGLSGAKITGPIADAWVALADLGAGDTAVYIQPANPDGTFLINNVPDGNYFFTYWDYDQWYIMDWMQVTVANGEITDLGTPFLTGWFTWISGYVFEDSNGNGFRDPGEQGISDYVVVLKERDNSVLDRMTIAVTTDMNGYYFFDRAYPLGSWIVLEAYNDRYYTTGVSFKTEVEPDWTTILGDPVNGMPVGGVDVSVLPILGHSGELDWGVRAYDAMGGLGPRNGGIVGTVSYDVTRNELDPRYAAVENWQTGVPSLTMQLWQPVACVTQPCDAAGMYELNADGSYKKGKLLNEYLTETWEQPVDCQARDANGDPTDQIALPPATGGYRCLEAPQMGLQFQKGYSTVDGNYGFVDGCFGVGGYVPATGLCADASDPVSLPAGDYLVEVVIPNDTFNRPKYVQTKEEDINVFGGDQFFPDVPPPACAGPLHTVDVAGIGTDNYPAVPLGNGVIVPASTPVANPSFVGEGGSPYEGTPRPLCSTKLVTLNNGKSIAPTFNLFTPVMIPGKWKGYIIDDLLISTNAMDLNFGEKAGLALPIGVYDFKNNLLMTIQSDPNGVYETLLPSTWSINCPTPSGVCPGTYFLLGNDPGQPGALNPNYNPQYRTIGASFEIWPGVMLPSDLAPTQNVAGIIDPGTGLTQPPDCSLANDTPQLLAVSVPYVDASTGGPFTIEGFGFGGTPGQVTIRDGTAPPTVLPTTAWTDTSITVNVPAGLRQGPRQLLVISANGQSTVNGLTFHVLGANYNPVLYWVNPPAGLPGVDPARDFYSADYTTGIFPGVIQAALNAAAGAPPGRGALVVVFPGPQEQWNPYGAYYENLLINARVKLQGVGPGGLRPDNSLVRGSVLDGLGVGGDTPYATAYRSYIDTLTWDGNQTVYEGAVIYILVPDGEFRQTYDAIIDGFTIQGGDQQANAGGGGVLTVQGGGIFANAYARYLRITNNILKSNGGAYGGAIRLGTPNLPGALNDNQNDNIVIANNRVFANGGVNLAGGIGIFSGANNYEVAFNDVCGNYSAEYGGGISHFGLSPNGKIHDNRVYFNQAYDEAGGIMIAGELPADPALLSPGAGPVDVYNNLIQANLGGDDGGGLRFLMAGNFPYNVYNNMIANNVSAHEGGGISLNDAPQVRVYNNTIMKNITTATAITSNGFPAPAGLSSARNSTLLQNSLPGGSPIYSNPVVFNNIFWDNRAGTWTGGAVAGIGMTGDPNPINYWDLGIADGSGLLTLGYSIFQQDTGQYPVMTVSSNNQQVDPLVVQTFDLTISVLPWRGNPRFVDVLLVAVQLPPNQMGNYHIQATSPAANTGATNFLSIVPPSFDYDNQGRPAGTGFDIGADELPGGPPTLPFPATGILDNFNRADGNLGSSWTYNFTTPPPVTRVRVNSLQAQVIGLGGAFYWNPTVFGNRQEAYLTFQKVVSTATEQALLLKLAGSPNPNAAAASLIEVNYQAASGLVQVRTKDSSQGWVIRANFPATFAPGDVFGARTLQTGITTVYKNGVLIGSVDLSTGAQPWPAARITGGGRIGVWFLAPSFALPNDARFDDFGGGNVP